ncbi:MAG TPA: c-type cytochrome [Bryobacteraceae bacterium]|nr:c-type cytochrome [Bryobacteraceae bacterium]
MRRYWLTLLALLPLFAQHDASDEGKKKKHPSIGNPKAIAAGRALFLNSCAGCHGVTGQGGRGPNLRQRGVWHPLDDDEMFKTIQKGVPGADMPATNLPEDQIWSLTAFVRSLTAPAMETNVAGNPGAGEQVYWGKAGCSNCHRILGRGGMLGPDLSNVGAIRQVEEIRESIIDPDADGFLRYKGVTAVLKDGRTIKGVARNRSNYSIQIQDAQGDLHLLPMSAVKDLSISDHSPMPRNYKERLSAQELTDLIAFLSRQTVRPYEAPEKK